MRSFAPDGALAGRLHFPRLKKRRKNAEQGIAAMTVDSATGLEATVVILIFETKIKLAVIAI